MIIVATFAIAGLGTYLVRAAPILLGERLLSSPNVESRIGLIAPAVLAAIVSRALLVGSSGISLPSFVELLAVAGAFAVVRRSGNVGLALAVGFPIYWLGVFAGLT